MKAKRAWTSEDQRQALDKANCYHAKATDAFGSALKYARLAGQHLRKLRPHFRYGQWLKWVDKNFDGGRRTAQIYMRIYDRWDELPTDTVTSINEALRRLSPTRQAGKKFDEMDLHRSRLFKEFLQVTWKRWSKDEMDYLKDNLPVDERLQSIVFDMMNRVKRIVRRGMGTLTDQDRREINEESRKLVRKRVLIRHSVLDGYEEQPNGTLKPRPLGELM